MVEQFTETNDYADMNYSRDASRSEQKRNEEGYGEEVIVHISLWIQ